MIRSFARLITTLAAIALLGAPAFAQENDDRVLNLAEPDFTLVGLPTALRLAPFTSAFRVTHRFNRALGAGDFGDLAGDLFGIDSGAQIGLEFRFGIVPNGQIGIHRTNDKTIELFSTYGVIRQRAASPVEVAALLTIEGTNNFRDSYSPALGAIVSRRFGEMAAVYVEPIWVNNTSPLPTELVDHNDTFIIGLGARVRVGSSVYLVGEVAPRVSGYDPGVHHGSFAIEKRVGGHVFQLNFSNSFATTIADIARGGLRAEDWYLGFNISRKFF